MLRGLTISTTLLLVLLGLSASCVKRPTSVDKGRSLAAANAAPIVLPVPEAALPVEVVPTDPTLKKIIPFAETGLLLGPAKKLKCGPVKPVDSSLPLGLYVNFEVLEEKTKFKLKLDSFCGDITKASIVLFNADTREAILSFPLPTTPIDNMEMSFDSNELKQGRYAVGFEVGGLRIEELSTLGLEKGSLTFDKYVRLEGVSEF